MNESAVIADTRCWIEVMVIGLNLCPFARRVFAGDLVRYAVTPATDADALRAALTEELTLLANTPRERVETTLLIHPLALADFLDYNDFLADADRLVDDLGFSGAIQIASFHPRYQFGGTEPDAVENYTNRSPHPMLHLLREESVSAVNHDEEVMAGIPERNIATLKALGLKRVREMIGNVKGRATDEHG